MSKKENKDLLKMVVVVLVFAGFLLSLVPTYILYIAVIIIIVVIVYVYRKKGLQPFKDLGSSAITGVKKIQAQNKVENRVPPLTQAQKEECIKLVGNRCCYPHCRETIALDVHHIIPREEGGSNKHSNLIVLCDTHHKYADRKAIPRERQKQYSVANVKGIR